MEQALIRSLMNKDFYDDHRGIRCPDKLFTKDMRKIKNSVDGLNLQMKSPLLAICTASLEWLNDRLTNPTSLEKLELRFRPNIVIKTSTTRVRWHKYNP